jgi:hypothetical protein
MSKDLLENRHRKRAAWAFSIYPWVSCPGDIFVENLPTLGAKPQPATIPVLRQDV